MKTLAERFWKKVNKSEGCWEWNGRVKAGKWNYGIISIERGKDVRAHRLSYQMHVGPIPSGIMVCHHCDNPRCVRPDHLFLGTNTDNMRDCWAKGRHMHQTCPWKLARGPANGSNTRPENVRRGTVIKWAKLTEELVYSMRREFASGAASGRELARRHGLYFGSAYKALYGYTWKHVPMPEGAWACREYRESQIKIPGSVKFNPAIIAKYAS